MATNLMRSWCHEPHFMLWSQVDDTSRGCANILDSMRAWSLTMFNELGTLGM